MRAIELGGDPPRAVLEGTKDEIRALVPLLGSELPLRVVDDEFRAYEAEHEEWSQILAAEAREDEGLTEALERILAGGPAGDGDEDPARDALEDAAEHLRVATGLLFRLHPELNDDVAEASGQPEARRLCSAISEAAGCIDAVLRALRGHP